MKKKMTAKQQMVMMMNTHKAGSAVKGLILLGVMLFFNPVSSFASEDNWSFSLGAGVFTENVYFGSDETYAAPIPCAKATYSKGNFSASLSLLEGIGIMYMDKENRFYGGINFNNGDERDEEGYDVLGRKKDHSDHVKKLLKGSPSVKTDVRTEMMIGYLSDIGIFSISLEYHPTDVDSEGKKNRSANCFIASLSYIKPFQISEKLTITGMIDLNVMDKDYADAWFSVEKPTQSLEAFNASAGLRDVQVVLQIDYMLWANIGITFLNGNSFLLMDAGDSPYTESKYQMTSAIFGYYNFL